MRTLLLLLALTASGCFVSFDPEGQPCDKQKKCLATYRCDATNHCVKGGSSGTSAGTSTTGTTTGGGTTTGSGTTTSTSSTSSTSGTTGATSCAGVICPAAQQCQLSGGTASCVPRTSETCSVAAACAGAGEVCITAGGGGGVGLCVSPCSLGADGGCPSGALCQAVVGERGNTFSACLPSPLPRSCSNSNDCAVGQVCQTYDSPSGGSATQALADELPVLLCDRLEASLLPLGSACTAPAQCQDGVCALEGDGGATCRAPCTADVDCGTGQACSAVDEVGLTRHVRACVSLVATGCNACGSCGADAPRCITAHGTCALPCDTSDVDPCGHGRSCVNDGAATYCAISGTTCP